MQIPFQMTTSSDWTMNPEFANLESRFMKKSYLGTFFVTNDNKSFLGKNFIGLGLMVSSDEPTKEWIFQFS